MRSGVVALSNILVGLSNRKCMKRHFFTLYFILLFSSLAFPQKKTNVILEGCEELAFDKQSGRDCQVLRGNVRFRHEDVLMFCDSAYFYDGTNSFDAFGHVRVIQNEETSMYSDSMFYDGNTTLMRARGAVELRAGKSSLKTHFLDFFRNQNYGYYYAGGEVYDTDYHITSKQGYYYTESKSYLFKDSVTLVHPNYIINGDSLRYNQNSSLATLLGPSVIYGNSYKVHTTKGWTYTNSSIGRLYNYSVIDYKDGRRMTADSMFFDANLGKVKAYHDAEVHDSTQKVIIRAQYMECDSTKPAYVLAHGNPYMIDYSDADSFFMRADTFRYCEIDSTHDEIRAYNAVRFYRNDMQGKCDSLVYYVQDSMAVMYSEPVIWSEKNQMTGAKRIDIYMKNKSPEKIVIPEKAFIISDEGDEQYNQLSGKKANAYIVNNKLSRVDLIGEATSLYYSKDDRDLLIGVNKARGTEMSIYLTKRNKLDKIIMTPDSEGVMYPPDRVPEEERLLKNFSWRESERPRSKEDIIK